MDEHELFALASQAFDFFTLRERKRALEVFAGVKFPSIADRFIHAVEAVIAESRTALGHER